MTSTSSPNTSALTSLLERLKIGLAVCGWIGLILGSMFGLMAARPELLADNLGDRWRLALLFRVGVILIIGLIEGFTVRRVMRETNSFVRFLTAMLGVLLAIVSFEVIDSQPSLTGIIGELISREFQRLVVLLTFIGAGAVLASMFAWRGLQIALPTWAAASATPAPASAPRTPANPPATPRRERQPRQQSAPTQGHIARRPPAQERAVNRARQARRASGNITTPQRIEVQPRMQEAPPKPTRARRKPKVNLKLGRTVTSICPYCLDEVLPNDPHGRMVCRTCGTAHHGDCWAITGRCAVPHG